VDKRRRAKAKPGFMGYLSGWGGLRTFVGFSNTLENAYCALMERVFYHVEGKVYVPPTIPKRDEVFRSLQVAANFISHSTYQTAPIPILEYPGRYYSGRKLCLYSRAADTVFRRGFQTRDAALQSFVKFEKILKKPNKRIVPRLIQPRSPEYNVLVGRYIKQLEHPLYHILDRMWKGPTVMKGLNSFQQGEAFATAWRSFSSPIAIMLDAVRFDQHVSIPMLEWEHSIYLAFFHKSGTKELSRLLREQLHNLGSVRTSEGRIKYKVDGCRMSGDMNTAMGNCLLMCSAVYGFVSKLGVRARLFNNGDDCTLIVEKVHSSLVKRELCPYFLKLGFIIDVEGTTDILEGISFCQTNPVYDGKSYRMVRDPRICLSKDSTLLKRWRGVSGMRIGSV